MRSVTLWSTGPNDLQCMSVCEILNEFACFDKIDLRPTNTQVLVTKGCQKNFVKTGFTQSPKVVSWLWPNYLLNTNNQNLCFDRNFLLVHCNKLIYVQVGLCNIFGLPIYCNIWVSNTYCNTYCVLSLIYFDLEPVRVHSFFFKNSL